jgi:hypothetical protein
MEAKLLVETAINIVVLSSMYILVALGFAFLFSMLRILNPAHGASDIETKTPPSITDTLRLYVKEN